MNAKRRRQGERWKKTTMGLISKKATLILHVQHTFLYISLPLFCTNTTWNFQKLLSYTFFGGNVVRVLVHLFFTAPHFYLALVAASISHVVTAGSRYKIFMLFFKKKNVSFFLALWSLALDLCRPFYRWASLACRRLSLFLCLSLALYFKFVDMTINLTLIL